MLYARGMKIPGLRIHSARPSELDGASEVIRAAYSEYETDIPAPAWREYVADITDVCRRLGVAELIVAANGLTAGAVTLFPASAGPGETGWPEGWAGIRILAVHPEYRGRGVGRALMDECLRRCRKRGTRTVGLHTTEFMSVARSMYERMGFVRVPEFDFHPRPGVTVMAYKLELPQPPD